MAEEVTPDQIVPEGRVGGSDPFKKAVVAAIGGLTGAAAGSPVSLTTQFISLHKSDPTDGTTAAASEVSGGSPAYARKQVAWGVPELVYDPDSDSNRAKISGASLKFDIPGGTTVTHYGVWTAAVGGTYLYGKKLSASVTISAQGAVTITPTHTYGLL